MRDTPQPTEAVTSQASRRLCSRAYTHVHMYTHPHTHQASSYWEFHVKDSITSSHFLGFPFQVILTRSPEWEAGQGLLSLHEHEKPRPSSGLLPPLGSPTRCTAPTLAPVLQRQHGLKPQGSLSLGGVGASLTGKCVSAALFTVVELFLSN